MISLQLWVKSPSIPSNALLCLIACGSAIHHLLSNLCEPGMWCVDFHRLPPALALLSRLLASSLMTAPHRQSAAWPWGAESEGAIKNLHQCYEVIQYGSEGVRHFTFKKVCSKPSSAPWSHQTWLHRAAPAPSYCSVFLVSEAMSPSMAMNRVKMSQWEALPPTCSGEVFSLSLMISAATFPPWGLFEDC